MTSVERERDSGEVRDWRTRGACRGTDPEVFFPTAVAGPELERAEAAAKRVCAGCPVRVECLAWAVEVLPFGVAGGLGEAERAALRHTRTRRTGRAGRPGVGRPARPGRGGVNAAPGREAGFAALVQGRDRARVAAECGVTRRTVDRWAAALHAQTVGGAR